MTLFSVHGYYNSFSTYIQNFQLSSLTFVSDLVRNPNCWLSHMKAPFSKTDREEQCEKVRLSKSATSVLSMRKTSTPNISNKVPDILY